MKYYLLNINPEPWAVGPVGVSRKAGKLIPYIGRNTQLYSYQEAIKEELGPQEILTGKITLRFYFWRNRADYITHQARSHRKHEADVTNLQKATEDALQGVFFENDKDVSDIKSMMVSQGPDTVGRIVIGIQESEAFRLPQDVLDLVEKVEVENILNLPVWVDGSDLF